MNPFLQSVVYKISIPLIFLTAIFAEEPLFAQVKFSVFCPNKTIGKNDLLQIQYKVENASNVESIIPPTFKNFNIVSGPDEQRMVNSYNGAVTQYVSVGFALQPRSTGTFTIGAATARADGKEYKSNPITVKVTNASTSQQSNNSANSLSPFANFNFDYPPAPTTHQFDDYILKPGEKVEDKIQKNLFIKLDVSKTTCYVGEPIIASFKLYTRLQSESTLTDAPSFNGFSVSDFDVNPNTNGSAEKYDGRQYNVYTLRKVQLYPLQPGNITLDTLVADTKVTFIKSEYANAQNGDGFYDMLQNFGNNVYPPNAVVEKNVTLKSQPVTIIVKPLPLENQPANFKGAVGNFTIQSSLEKNKITTDDAANLKITISGQGNIQLVNAPKINWPKGIDGYDAKVKVDIDKSSIPMRGTKTFTFPFTVSNAGEYQIDSIPFSYFDPVSSSYKTLHTSPLEIHVTKGTGNTNNLYAKNSAKTDASNNGFFTPNRLDLIAGIILSAGIIFLILFIINKKNKNKNLLGKNIQVENIKRNVEEKKPEFIIPENPLLAAHEKLIEQNSGAFYHVLDASLKKYLSYKFKVPANELTKKKLNEELDKRNVGLGTSLMLNSLMEEVEINLYAPPSNVNHLKTVFEKASEVISLLDKQVS